MCRGPNVTSIIESSTENEISNLSQIKAKLASQIFGTDTNSVSVDAFNLAIYGRNRNLLKVECINSNVKECILRKAKTKRPRGIYVVDFLSPNRLKIHHRLIDLRKEKTAALKGIFTRRGCVFGRISDEEILKFDSLEEVEEFRRRIANDVESSNIALDEAISHPSPAPTSPSPSSNNG